MDKPTDATTAAGSDTDLDKRVSTSFIKLAELFGTPTPSWLPSWIEGFLLPSGSYDVFLDKSKPSRGQRLRTLGLDRESNLSALDAAREPLNELSIRKLTLKRHQIEAEISTISRLNGMAKPGPNKGHVTPKILMVARLVEVFLFVNGREPSDRNPNLAIALVSLLDTLGILRIPIGNRLNGVRQAFKRSLSVTGKVNHADFRKNDVIHDEIVLARLQTRRSLEQRAMLGRAPWTLTGMNGPVIVYRPEIEI